MNTTRICSSICTCLWALSPLSCADSDTATDTDNTHDSDADAGDETDADGGDDTESETGTDTEEGPSAAEKAVAAMKIGWNLGNTLDAFQGETAWGNPLTTPELIQAVADLGFGAVRVPVTWTQHMGGAPDYTIDKTWMDRVEEVVGYVLDAGLYAIINLHHDGADNAEEVEWIILGDTTGTVEDRFAKVWSQIAERFKDHDDHLIFESMNEIHDGYNTPPDEYYDDVNNLNQIFVDIVRESGSANAERLLLVPGYNTNIQQTFIGFEKPTDTAEGKLILSVHYYDPWSFAGAADTQTWGADSPGSDASGQEDWVDRIFDGVRTRYIEKGLPVIVGEYGAVRQEGYDDYRRYYIEYVTKAVHDSGAVPMFWDNGIIGEGGEPFGLIDRTDNSVAFPEILDAMMRAVNDDYTALDIALPQP